MSAPRRQTHDGLATFLLIVVFPIQAVTALALVDQGHNMAAFMVAAMASLTAHTVFRRWGWRP